MTQQQKKELAKYYTSMSGINETSVNAYMAIAGQDQSGKPRRVRRKKKRAVSQAAGHANLMGDDSK